MQVTYVSACFDASGYAEAARNHIAALDSVGVKVAVDPVSFEGFKSDLGKLGVLVSSMVNQKAKNDIQILHLTPENYNRYINRGRYNIGYCAWETDKLPEQWIPLINQCDELWVPCEHNVKAFKDSGITKPVFSMPHPLDLNYVEQVDASNSVFANVSDNDYIFYSIFQWTERKNPLGLLKAYLTEFDRDENVVLVLKTYLANPGSPQESNKIKTLIKDIKARLYLRSYPKILLVSSLLSRQQIQALHAEGDCFISTHRCEGFGLPIAEAMLAGNPVITTGYGGPADFVQKNKTGFPIDYRLTPCYGMPWPTYTGKMLWADPDVMNTREHMRYIYENQEKAKLIGCQGQEFLKKNYNWEILGNKMKNRLLEIEGKLNG